MTSSCIGHLILGLSVLREQSMAFEDGSAIVPPLGPAHRSISFNLQSLRCEWWTDAQTPLLSGEMVLRSERVPAVLLLAPLPHLQTCSEAGREILQRPLAPAAVAISSVPIVKLSQTWMPFLQASVWYVWYIRLLFNPTIYQAYSYSVLPFLRGS